MEKTEIVHTRVSPETKKACEEIFKELGITTSYAISLFLNQVRIRKGIPFDIALPEEDLVTFAENVSLTGAKPPSEEAKIIMRLYDEGIISLEAAEQAIRKLHKKEK